ncbi:DUF938 domain-containing protein [Sphingomicrobium clamense]|uniref:DUF938 domain-containing protein n=1 Tax=Sphingomicrobium clamense TaxID=2851013 RepID=A0ABS6V5M8_9SPHN|nr:DUF938 domain-containing protein [Sphingomicrobium sp. B8]MBW0144843.1 DUF938 domain-containing protein [Sphingomicrobium sp. B8]
MSDPLPPYEMGDLGSEVKRHAPAAARNVGPIGEVLTDWLPRSGTVLEIASGTGEHALAFARIFPDLDWQPSDRDPEALASIAAWREEHGTPNLLPPVEIDAASTDWPIMQADAILSVNMAHISPWPATLGLLKGAKRLLPEDGALIFYGPWIASDVETAPSNMSFDESLKVRNPAWGLRTVEKVEEAASAQSLQLIERRSMPANNMMLLFRRRNHNQG